MRRFSYTAFAFLVASSIVVYLSACSVSSQGQPWSSLSQQDQSNSKFAKFLGEHPKAAIHEHRKTGHREVVAQGR